MTALAFPKMTPGLCFGLLIVMLRKVMLAYCPPAGAVHVAVGSFGQQMLHGWAAQRSGLSDCCAGPIQIAHCSGASITMFCTAA
jgi:hypothetical protein